MFKVKTLHSWWFKRDIGEKLEPASHHKYIVSRGSHEHAAGNTSANVCSWNQENLEFVGQTCAELLTYHPWMIGCILMHRCANVWLIFFMQKRYSRDFCSIGIWELLAFELAVMYAFSSTNEEEWCINLQLSIKLTCFAKKMLSPGVFNVTTPAEVAQISLEFDMGLPVGEAHFVLQNSPV